METYKNPYRFQDALDEHLHVLDDKPLFGNTTAVGVIDKHLEWWAVNKALEKFGYLKAKTKTGKHVPVSERLASAGAKLEEIKKMEDRQFLDLLDAAYRAHQTYKMERADSGKAMHAELEKYVKHCIEKCNGRPVAPSAERDPKDPVSIFALWAMANVKRFIFSELHCYSREHWVGGVSDCGFEDINGNYCILDFKSSADVYTTHFIQAGGYDIMLTENKGGFDAKGNKIFELDKPFSYYAILPFGMETPDVVIHTAIDDMKEAFLAALKIHKILKKYKH